MIGFWGPVGTTIYTLLQLVQYEGIWIIERDPHWGFPMRQ